MAVMPEQFMLPLGPAGVIYMTLYTAVASVHAASPVGATSSSDILPVTPVAVALYYVIHKACTIQ